MVKVSKFDVVDYLDSEEMIEEYLKAVKEEGNPDLLRSALSNVATNLPRMMIRRNRVKNLSANHVLNPFPVFAIFWRAKNNMYKFVYKIQFFRQI